MYDPSSGYKRYNAISSEEKADKKVSLITIGTSGLV